MLGGLRKITAIVYEAIEREDPNTWDTLQVAQNRGGALDHIGDVLIDIEDDLGVDLHDDEVAP